MNTMEKFNMCAIDIGSIGSGPNYTFSSVRGRSYIDHIIVSEKLRSHVWCEVFEDTIHNVSDHLAIQARLELANPIVRGHTPICRHMAWHKASSEQIHNHYTSPLEQITEEIVMDLLNLIRQMSNLSC